jgi:hypothetical protein
MPRLSRTIAATLGRTVLMYLGIWIHIISHAIIAHFHIVTIALRQNLCLDCVASSKRVLRVVYTVSICFEHVVG